MAKASKLAFAAGGFALAAALACWNPLAAPFGLVVGLGSALLSLRALRRGGRRAVAVVALAISIAAVVGSGVVLARTAGVGRDLTGQPVVSGPTGEEANRLLDEEAERTRAARGRARDELGNVGGEPGGAPREPPRLAP